MNNPEVKHLALYISRYVVKLQIKRQGMRLNSIKHDALYKLILEAAPLFEGAAKQALKLCDKPKRYNSNANPSSNDPHMRQVRKEVSL